MKRIALSLMTIATVALLSVSATSAYFSDTKAVAGNTFATGTVKLGSVYNMPVKVTNLIPGIAQTTTVGFQYAGSTKADVYLGNRGNAATPAYRLADVLYVKIVDHANSSNVLYEGWANGLASAWRKVATNISAGWQYYDVTFTLSSSAGNDYQNKVNKNTEFLFYAVQTGGSIPTTVPYMTTTL